MPITALMVMGIMAIVEMMVLMATAARQKALKKKSPEDMAAKKMQAVSGSLVPFLTPFCQASGLRFGEVSGIAIHIYICNQYTYTCVYIYTHVYTYTGR